MKNLTLVKIGGNLIDDEKQLSASLEAFAKIDDATGPQTIMGEDGKEKIVQGLSEQSAGLLKYAAIAETTGAVLSSFGQLMQADSNRRIAAIDSQIEAENVLIPSV